MPGTGLVGTGQNLYQSMLVMKQTDGQYPTPSPAWPVVQMSLHFSEQHWLGWCCAKIGVSGSIAGLIGVVQYPTQSQLAAQETSSLMLKEAADNKLLCPSLYC